MSIQIEQTNMIKQQLRTGDVHNKEVLALFDQIPRHAFVPGLYQHFAYSDMQIELTHQQRMMSPLEEAKLLQALNLNGTEVVLEVGTGTGFLTALLSRLCKSVISIDYFPEFTKHAQQQLNQFNCHNVELYTGDASRGWMEKAPYDVILFTGAIETFSETHQLQLLPGGKCFVILGRAPIMQGLLYQLDHQQSWSAELIFETCLPPLIDRLKPKNFLF